MRRKVCVSISKILASLSNLFDTVLFQYILVDKRNDKHMEPHIRLDAVSRSDPIRSLSTEYPCTLRRQTDCCIVTGLLSGKIKRFVTFQRIFRWKISRGLLIKSIFPGLHDIILGLPHVLLPKREGLLVFLIVRPVRHSSESALDIHVGCLLRFLVSQGQEMCKCRIRCNPVFGKELTISAQDLQRFYLITVLAIFIFAMALQVPRLNVNGNVKLIVFVGWAAYGVLPTLHWSIAMGGMDNPIVRMLLPRVLGMYLISGAAFAIYLSKIPERFFPGKCSSLRDQRVIGN